MNINRLSIITFFIILISFTDIVLAQSGMSVSPPRTYFTLNAGESETKKIKVINTSNTEILDLSISFNDWKYDELGSNIILDPNSTPISCADWIKVSPSNTFILGPNEEIDLDIQLNVPTNINEEDIHTVMMYFTQTNIIEREGQKGETLILTLQTGVKIYQRLNTSRNLDIDFTNFSHLKNDNKLVLQLENTGNVWAEGTIVNELINQETGQQFKLEDQVFYSIPKDKRTINIPLPNDLPKGDYLVTSTFDLGEKDLIKIAELNFTNEK